MTASRRGRSHQLSSAVGQPRMPEPRRPQPPARPRLSYREKEPTALQLVIHSIARDLEGFPLPLFGSDFFKITSIFGPIISFSCGVPPDGTWLLFPTSSSTSGAMPAPVAGVGRGSPRPAEAPVLPAQGSALALPGAFPFPKEIFLRSFPPGSPSRAPARPWRTALLPPALLPSFCNAPLVLPRPFRCGLIARRVQVSLLELTAPAAAAMGRLRPLPGMPLPCWGRFSSEKSETLCKSPLFSEQRHSQKQANKTISKTK